MGKKAVLLTLTSLFLVFVMFAAASATTRTAGVSGGDWFQYGVTVNWSSNDPSATVPAGYEVLNGTVEKMTVDDVHGTNVTGHATGVFTNGTQTTSAGWLDVATGDSKNLTDAFISANLSAGDTVYTSGALSNVRINETIPVTYSGGARDTNHVSLTEEIGTPYGASIDYYWDKSTGAMVEQLYESLNQTGVYNTTLVFHLRITDSAVWAIPEFPSWTSTLLVLIALTPAIIATYRRRPLKGRVC
jgi:hypothetical protein